MKKHALLIISLFVLLAGIGMFIFGGSMFSYKGQPLSNFVSKLAEFSFMFWLPTIILGLALLIFHLRLKG